jgi:hypothetical protein
MKTIFSLQSTFTILAIYLFPITNIQAQQETPPFGFVRIVNAVSHGNGNATFSLDQEDIYPSGYKLGQDCGGISIKKGSHSITVSKNGVNKGTTKIDVVTGETTTVIAFAELIPPVKKEDPPVWTIKLLKLKQKDVDNGYALTVVSVENTREIPVTLEMGFKGTTQNHTLIRLKPTYVSLGATRGDISIKMGKKNLTTVSPDTPGNYVVVLYQEENGETTAVYFFDPKFTVAG